MSPELLPYPYSLYFEGVLTMTDDPSKTIATIKKRYLNEYSSIYGKDERIAFFKEIGKKAASVGASSWNMFTDGMVDWVYGNTEAALKLFDEAIAIDPELAYPWHGKGNVLNDLARYDESLESYEKAIAIDPEFAYPWNGKGIVLNTLARYDEAIETYDRAIDLDENDAMPWNRKDNIFSNDARRAFKRFCFLAKSREIMKVPGNLLNEFYHSGCQAPLLLLKQVAQTPNLLTKPGWFEATRDLQEAYDTPLVCLDYINKKIDGTFDRRHLRAAGCLAFHLGDPMVAEEYFDFLNDDFPEDLLGQYYLLSSLYEYWADVAPCLTEALEVARAYQDNDAEQHYYAARIFAFAEKNQEVLKALKNAGNYAPALLLLFDMEREQGNIPAMIDLATRLLNLERDTPSAWRLLNPTLPKTFDLSAQDWLMVVIHYVKQQELIFEIKVFLEQLDKTPFFELRYAYADVLLDTQMGAWDIKTAWNLDAKSQKCIDDLMADQNESLFAEMRAELEEEDVNMDKIEAIPDDKLEFRLASRLENDKASFKKERLLNSYLYKRRRLALPTSFTLMLFSLAKEGHNSPDHIKKSLFDAYLSMVTSVEGTALFFGLFKIGVLDPTLINALGSAAIAGISSLLWRLMASRKEATRKAAEYDFNYITFKAELRTLSEANQLDLSESFWETT